MPKSALTLCLAGYFCPVRSVSALNESQHNLPRTCPDSMHDDVVSGVITADVDGGLGRGRVVGGSQLPLSGCRSRAVNIRLRFKDASRFNNCTQRMN